MHDHAGGLVEHGHVGILVEDFEWERLAGKQRRRHIRDIDADALPSRIARLGLESRPSIVTCPSAMSFWIWERERPRGPTTRKRSSRWPLKSGGTVNVSDNS